MVPLHGVCVLLGGGGVVGGRGMVRASRSMNYSALWRFCKLKEVECKDVLNSKQYKQSKCYMK